MRRLTTLTGRSLASVAIAGGADDMYYDAVLQPVYVSCGAGSLDIVTQGNGDAYRFNARLETASGARNSAFSSELSSIFVAVPQRGKQPAEIRVFLIDDVVTRLRTEDWHAF